MEYKISELVALTDVPKSTILYYIREGLLPEAKKIKSNVHRYSDEHVELIRYIKYMKEEIGSSNEQIKSALKNKNRSFSTSLTMIEPLMNTLSGIPADEVYYTKEAFITHFNVDRGQLDSLLEDGIIVPIQEEHYTEKEAAIVKLITSFKEVGVDYAIIKAYVQHAKALSELEYQMQAQLCSVNNEGNFSALWKIMFDTLFNAKSYLFNRYTYKVLLKRLREEVIK